ncbi:hypothetical protein [Yinghuangia seranimata]|uniref:hypothetical protein n=1 Tax=Yinghuangia seranimata TaxID=408067 RepID=UPI00248CA596|nr:hypothetical protein [Yinghuangia seranimata]MDI2130388.1 hypothetical protein [Yinghuangia seranimata]
MRAHRNQPGGFWVAATNPDAAAEALTGRTPLADVRSFMALSDGASRLVDRFELTDWPGAFKLIQEAGPAHLIERVRAAEDDDPRSTRWPRGKAKDDATAAFYRR